jgi:hypothetical protein
VSAIVYFKGKIAKRVQQALGLDEVPKNEDIADHLNSASTKIGEEKASELHAEVKEYLRRETTALAQLMDITDEVIQMKSTFPTCLHCVHFACFYSTWQTIFLCRVICVDVFLSSFGPK